MLIIPVCYHHLVRLLFHDFGEFQENSLNVPHAIGHEVRSSKIAFLHAGCFNSVIKPTPEKSIANTDKRTGKLVPPHIWTKLRNKLWVFVWGTA